MSLIVALDLWQRFPLTVAIELITVAIELSPRHQTLRFATVALGLWQRLVASKATVLTVAISKKCSSGSTLHDRSK